MTPGRARLARRDGWSRRSRPARAQQDAALRAGALRTALAAGADERGTVTAEFAVALPAAVLVLALAVGAIQAAALQLRVVDAATVAARTVGRGETVADADGRVSRLIGEHGLVTSADGDFVCAVVSAPLAFGALRDAGVDVSARSCALGGGQ